MGQQYQPYYSKRHLCWDEENRLVSFADCENAGFYQYDANGERTYKLTGGIAMQNIQGHWRSYNLLDNPTLYTSPYLVATSKGYTKHYYAENERVASRIGGGGLEMVLVSIVEPDTFLAKTKTNVQHAKAVAQCLTDKEYAVHSLMEGLYEWKDILQAESDCYWYHPDHLGSSSWITYSDGKAVQHLHYMPWGEDFVNQRTTNYAARFTFSAKEKDAETGYSYFGSRYYNSDLSIWLSVDPMSDKYPSMSPYVYCANNPIKLVDPNGEEIGDYFNQEGKYLGTDCVDDGKIYIIHNDDWEFLKGKISWEGNDGTHVISQSLGEILSDKPSSLDLSDDAIQNIVGHYNSTGLKLNRGNEGALNTEFNGNEKSYTITLTINIEKWRKSKYLDNYYDIISSFDNEKGHIKQCKEVGIVKFNDLTPYQQEKYAVDYQKSQPAFSRTSDKYKKWVDTYLQGKKK